MSLTSDRDERLVIGAELFDGRTWLRVVSSRPQPQRKWVVQFDGIADRNAAELLTGRQLFAAPVADDDALWVHELIGARVIDAAGIDHGVCVSVVDNPAHDILELDSGHLVPVTFVVSLADGVITGAAPDGLFDLLD